MQNSFLILPFWAAIGLAALPGHAPTVPAYAPQPVWSDEFNYDGLPDTAKWGYEVGYIRNGEKQYYTRARMENARVKNGVLILQARRDSATIDGKVRPITSASLLTKGKAAWTYGRVEVRAKLPRGRGTWPAIWMLGADIDRVGWPDCGEIDIMEHVGFDPGVIHGTIHTRSYYWVKGTQKSATRQVADCMDQFHVYAIDWTPEKIDFYIDQEKYLSFPNQHLSKKEWPFDDPCYLILNIAIGGSWGGQKGIDERLFPATMEVDYVRVYGPPKTPADS